MSVVGLIFTAVGAIDYLAIAYLVIASLAIAYLAIAQIALDPTLPHSGTLHPFHLFMLPFCSGRPAPSLSAA